MTLKAKLANLYTKGQEVTVGESTDAPVTVYLRKILPLENEEAFRTANAAKSATMAAKNQPDSSAFLVVTSRCNMASREEMLDYLIALDVQKRQPVVTAEVESGEEWSKDDYLQGLYDRWEADLKEAYFDEDHVRHDEAKTVKSELERFDDVLQKRLSREEESIRKDWESKPSKKVEDAYFDALFEQQSDLAWIRKYRRMELYFALRNPEDISQPIFDAPEEMDNLPPELIEELQAAYREISVDALEGKG